ncbi:MAG TPA: 50S ribosomal protein L25, partial [Chloroflexi bacterium]|nr:50S ribosomal protein L25 [Chloroflexota bacterium]
EVLGKKVKAMRREGKLPAVIFGHTMETTPITLDMRDASKILAGVGSSTLVTIQLDGMEHAALVRERQHNVLSRALLHVDFQAVSLTETVRASVALILGDEDAPAVKAYGAMIIQGAESLEIECLPQYLPERIVVDLSSLKNIGDSIHIKDLPVMPGVEILDDPDTMVVVATALSEASLEDTGEGGEPEVIGADDED